MKFRIKFFQFKRPTFKTYITLGFIALLLIIYPFAIHALVTKSYAKKMYKKPADVPKHYSVLVLGAGLKYDATPSDILYDRLYAAKELYKAGKIKKIIVSGDNRVKGYNEPDAMKNTLIKMGIPEKVIQPDYAGRRTYDSCWRAKHIFSQDEIIVVTQEFHMVRSIYTCNSLGVKSVGMVATGPHTYLQSSLHYWGFRDVISFQRALLDTFFKPAAAVGGEKIEI